MERASNQVRIAEPAPVKTPLSGVMGPRKQIRCVCGHFLFDGIVVRSRVIRVQPRGEVEALCRCKRWQTVPLTFDPAANIASPDTKVSTTPL